MTAKIEAGADLDQEYNKLWGYGTTSPAATESSVGLVRLDSYFPRLKHEPTLSSYG
ncbi:hypothetical protein [Cytobacillus horneckiae]|uniref:hypothetical protein n=1 Tax=Cytobacillus horneckiae TaxID=549687 RepID=UPI003D9A3FCF